MYALRSSTGNCKKTKVLNYETWSESQLKLFLGLWAVTKIADRQKGAAPDLNVEATHLLSGFKEIVVVVVVRRSQIVGRLEHHLQHRRHGLLTKEADRNIYGFVNIFVSLITDALKQGSLNPPTERKPWEKF